MIAFKVLLCSFLCNLIDMQMMGALVLQSYVSWVFWARWIFGVPVITVTGFADKSHLRSNFWQRMWTSRWRHVSSVMWRHHSQCPLIQGNHTAHICSVLGVHIFYWIALISPIPFSRWRRNSLLSFFSCKSQGLSLLQHVFHPFIWISKFWVWTENFQHYFTVYLSCFMIYNWMMCKEQSPMKLC